VDLRGSLRGREGVWKGGEAKGRKEKRVERRAQRKHEKPAPYMSAAPDGKL